MKRIALLWKVIKNDVHLLWFALWHPNRPGWLIRAIALVAVVDDGVLVPLALHLIVRGSATEIDI